jgi:parallel beta-helix repeat protein
MTSWTDDEVGGTVWSDDESGAADGSLTGSEVDVDADKVRVIDATDNRPKLVTVEELVANTSVFTQSGTATSETLASRGQWRVWLTDYMSAADRASLRAGSTVDVTTAISTALTAMSAGQELAIPFGSYSVTAERSVSKANITFRGYGKPTIAFSGSMASSNIFSVGAVDGVKFFGIKFTGDSGTDVSSYDAGSAIEFVSSTGFVVDDCEMDSLPKTGVVVKASSKFRITNNVITNIVPVTTDEGTAGISINDASSAGLVQGNRIDTVGSTSLGGVGIRVIEQTSGQSIPQEIIVTDNQVYNTGWHGIMFYDAGGSNSDGSVVSNNIIQNTGRDNTASEERGNGIYIDGVSGVVINGNTIKNVNVSSDLSANIGQAGIAVMSPAAATTTQPTVISNNAIETCEYDGIRCQSITNLTISGNVIKDYKDNGIKIADCEKFTIANNTINAAAASSNNGIALTASPGANEDGSITGNVIDCVSTAQALAITSAVNVSVTGNTIVEYATIGVLLTTCTRVNCSANTFYSATAAAVTFQTSGASTDCNIEVNNVTDRATFSQPRVINSGTGVRIVTRGSAVPNQSTWAVGDTVYNTVPAAGEAIGWTCITAGTPGTWGAFGNVPSVNTSAVGNVGTGEDDLMTFSLPAGTLAAAAQGVRITAWGSAANSANAKTLKLYFGSAAVLTTSLTTNQAGVWRAVAEVFSTGTDAQQYVSQLVQGGTTTLVDAEQGTTTQDDGAAITIKCTGEATSDNEVVQEGLLVEVLR